MTKEELKARTKKFAIDTFKFLNEIEKIKLLTLYPINYLNLRLLSLQIIERFVEENQRLIF